VTASGGSGPRRLVAGAAATAVVVLLALLGYTISSSSRIGLIVVAVVLPALAIATWTVRNRHPEPRASDAERDWLGSAERFDRLRGEFAAYECDLAEVLRLPARADVTVPGTARFVEAFAEAQALRTDHHPGDAAGARFAAAVATAERAWDAARDAAERIGVSALAPGELAAVERVLKLLGTARGTDSEPERVVAYARARAELSALVGAGVLHLPPAARAALDDGARGALPPVPP
jgi:hypothetical protein